MNRLVWLFWAIAYHLLTLVMVVFVLMLTIICTLIGGPEFSAIGVGLMVWFVYARFAWYWKPFRNRKKRELGLVKEEPKVPCRFSDFAEKCSERKRTYGQEEFHD